MDSRQLHYLKALDIDVWVRRDLLMPAAGAAQPAMPLAEEKQTLRQAQHSALRQAGQSDISTTLNDRTPVAEPFDAAQDKPVETRCAELVEASRVDSAMAAKVSHASWDELAASVQACTACALHATRTQTVFGVGNRQAEWMIVGEAPGADEDRQGEPFVGRAGQLLNSMLQAAGFPREQVFIANILKCRPPGNLDPKPEEVASCLPYLLRQIELVNPRIILCVGRIAAQNLLNTEVPIGKLRGQVHRLGSAQRPVVVTYHPAYLLRSPGDKRKAWEDLKLALATFAATAERDA